MKRIILFVSVFFSLNIHSQFYNTFDRLNQIVFEVVYDTHMASIADDLHYVVDDDLVFLQDLSLDEIEKLDDSIKDAMKKNFILEVSNKNSLLAKKYMEKILIFTDPEQLEESFSILKRFKTLENSLNPVQKLQYYKARDVVRIYSLFREDSVISSLMGLGNNRGRLTPQKMATFFTQKLQLALGTESGMSLKLNTGKEVLVDFLLNSLTEKLEIFRQKHVCSAVDVIINNAGPYGMRGGVPGHEYMKSVKRLTKVFKVFDTTKSMNPGESFRSVIGYVHLKFFGSKQAELFDGGIKTLISMFIDLTDLEDFQKTLRSSVDINLFSSLKSGNFKHVATEFLNDPGKKANMVKVFFSKVFRVKL